MQHKLTVMFAALTLLSSNVTNAEPEILAYIDADLTRLIDVPAAIDKNIDDVQSKHHYDIQPQTSKIEFQVDSPIGVISASFDNFGGSFSTLDTGSHKESAAINVNTDSLLTDNSFIESMLRGENFFDVKNFPSMRFSGDSFEWINETHAVLKGRMTIKNLTRAVAFYVELINADDNGIRSERITMKATANIKRSDFEIFSLLPIVSDDVSILVSINALKHEINYAHAIGINKNSEIAIHRLNEVTLDTVLDAELKLASIGEDEQREAQKTTFLKNRFKPNPCSSKSARFTSSCR